MRKSIFLAAAALLAACAPKAPEKYLPDGAITAGENTRVETTYGTIEGYLDGTIYTFKGIRYAKAERFMPPQAPDRWEGVRQCKLYGPQTPQTETLNYNDNNTQTDYGFGNQFFLEPMDEACQVLNVWTPSITDGKKRPVFLWIHGGGYSSGSGHDLPCYEGRALALKGDIVVVNINHRLNVLGYLDLTGLGGKYAQSVNLGQQDIVKALEWVRDNIARFGGDPASVTIGGQSGGGGKVSALLAMPAAKGLFRRAVVQSGSFLNVADPAATRQQGIDFVKALGVKPGPDADLSKFSYDELLAASRQVRAGAGPVGDGVIIAMKPGQTEAPELSRDIPLLVGTNFNEFTFDVGIDGSEAAVREQLSRRYRDRADAFLEAFRAAYPDAPLKDAVYADFNFRGGAVRQAAAKARQGGAPAYLYLFTWMPKENVLGASHGMELPFMFNNVQNMREMTGGTDRAYKFQETVSDIWLSFIKTGDPNIPGIPTWEPYSEENGFTMILDDVCHGARHHDDALINFGR
ncbi:MAG: carboxylesterase/lipase family protein [Bacteroidales bacterium]|nr:carboxylesterase/lipase family protein [Bacteroidales bacterium]